VLFTHSGSKTGLNATRSNGSPGNGSPKIAVWHRAAVATKKPTNTTTPSVLKCTAILPSNNRQKPNSQPAKYAT
jgi:hypothetical protein